MKKKIVWIKACLYVLAVVMIGLGLLFPTKTVEESDLTIYDAFLYRKAVLIQYEETIEQVYWTPGKRPDVDTIRMELTK